LVPQNTAKKPRERKMTDYRIVSMWCYSEYLVLLGLDVLENRRQLPSHVLSLGIAVAVELIRDYSKAISAFEEASIEETGNPWLKSKVAVLRGKASRFRSKFPARGNVDRSTMMNKIF
jgi:hypothetical protein